MMRLRGGHHHPSEEGNLIWICGEAEGSRDAADRAAEGRRKPEERSRLAWTMGLEELEMSHFEVGEPGTRVGGRERAGVPCPG